MSKSLSDILLTVRRPAGAHRSYCYWCVTAILVHASEPPTPIFTR